MAKEKQDSQTDAGKRKKAYARPRLRTIELSAEETLAVGCKMADGGSSPGGFTCISNSCSEAGS